LSKKKDLQKQLEALQEQLKLLRLELNEVHQAVLVQGKKSLEIATLI